MIMMLNLVLSCASNPPTQAGVGNTLLYVACRKSLRIGSTEYTCIWLLLGGRRWNWVLLIQLITPLESLSFMWDTVSVLSQTKTGSSAKGQPS